MFLLTLLKGEFMFYIWMICLCLMATSGFAETIGPVEYRIPENWKIAKQLQSDKKVKSNTAIYVPTYAIWPNTKEIFTAHVNDLSSVLNEDTAKKAMEKGVNAQIDFHMIDARPDSILFEWSPTSPLKDSDDHKKQISKQVIESQAHFLTRVFSYPGGTVMLTYESDDPKEFEKARPLWIKTLNQASMKKN